MTAPSKNAFTLKRVDGDLKWLQYKTKSRPRYGLIHINHPDDLFTFDKEQIEELNRLDISERRAKKSENKIKIGRKTHDLLFSLRSQMRDFISNEIKKLDVSGECLISSDFSSYPARQRDYWPEKNTSPYIEQTRFGMAFFQFNNKKEGISYIEDWIDYNRRDDWTPRVIVW